MLGVKKFIDTFHTEVDWNKKAKADAKARGVPVEEVKKEWKQKQDKGERMHQKIQASLEGCENVESFHCVFDKNKKDNIFDNLPVSDTILENGKIYLERPIFSTKHGLIGFPDKVTVTKNTIHVEDIKTWGKIYFSAPKVRTTSGWEKPKMFPPLDDFDDCNYIHAVLQLSVYMYILWENNRHLKVGKLTIRHIQTNNNDDIIKDEIIEVPYLREQVRAMLKHKKLNQL